MNEQTRQEIEELNTLQQEALELRKRRDQTASETVAEAVAPENTLDSVSGAGVEAAQTEDQKYSIESLAAHVGDLVQELEEAASEHPALALLAAFGMGVVAGQLLSRRGEEP